MKREPKRGARPVRIFERAGRETDRERVHGHAEREKNNFDEWHFMLIKRPIL